jgi:hypothetical protein
MGLQLDNLDHCTRRYMLDELTRDISEGQLYLDPRLTERGRAEYVGLLQVAVQRGAHTSLADDLRSHGRMRLIQEWQRPRGGITVVALPVTAPDALAEGEFHRLYARGLCRRALGAGIRRLVIYRASAATTPRANSDALVGTRIDGGSLLEDLRTPRGVTSPRGLPVCLAAGLSVRLPRAQAAAPGAATSVIPGRLNGQVGQARRTSPPHPAGKSPASWGAGRKESV